jgi:DNA-binding response OmpR family regulator
MESEEGVARILVIDDDHGVRGGVVAYLQRLGHDVVEASDGSLGMKVLRAQSIDLVITDINMPDMDGIEVIAQLREAADAVPVIAMSGGGLFAKELLLANAEMLGAVHTLAKPFDLDDLAAAVREALAG